jgi:putative hydrolase of the HAD superfamily
MSNCLIFDLDDTLYLEREYVFSGFKEIDKFLLKDHKLKGFYKIAKYFFEKGERDKIFNLSLKELDFSFDENFILSLIDLYRDHEPNITLTRDSFWALNKYKNSNLGLITDGHSNSQIRKIKALRLKRYLKKIIVTDELGKKYWKPNPKAYKLIENYFHKDSEPQNFFYIGDNPIKDFISPKKLGWITIQISRKDSVYKFNKNSIIQEADYSIKSLFELEKIIKP